MKKKLLAGCLSCMVVIASTATGFATTSNSEKVNVNANEVVSEEALHLTLRDIKEYENYQDDLAQGIKKSVETICDSSNISEIIEKNVTESKYQNIISEKIQDITKKDSDDIVQDKNIDHNIIDKYTKTYDLNDNYSLVLTPTEIYLDELEVKEVGDSTSSEAVQTISLEPFLNKTSKAAEWKTVKVVAARSLFTSTGKQAASVHTGGCIKYNGSQAKYHSDFYGYPLLHLTTYKKDSFEKVKEPSGNSYQFRAQGTFYKEFMGISSSKVISCKVKVSPSGKVSKSYYPAL